jgi:peptidoglycan/LPS O-acetylase OafA/YrhL
MGTLRTLLALAVCINHAGGLWGYLALDGALAVQAFYVLSGFYIAWIYNEKYIHCRRSAVVFWTNRYLRLAPAYAVVSLAAYFALDHHWLEILAAPFFALALLSQATMIGQDAFMFLGYQPEDATVFFTPHFRELTATDGIPGFYFMLIPQGWSLGVEIWFYLLAPVLVRQSPRVLSFLVVTFLAMKWAAGPLLGLKGDPWSYRFFPFELATFLLGALAYRAWARRKRARSWQGPVTFAGLMLVALAYAHLPMAPTTKSLLFLAALAAGLPDIFEWTRRSALDRVVGGLSYPLYIVHMLCLSLLSGIVASAWHAPVGVGLSLGAAVLLAVAVEGPCERLRRVLTRRFALSPPGNLAALASAARPRYQSSRP